MIPFFNLPPNLDKRFLAILGIPLLFLLASYQAKLFQSKSIPESELQVLKEIVVSDTIPTVYYKTINSDLNQSLSRQLFYLSDFDICSSLVNLDSMKLKKEERDYLVDRFSTMEVFNVNKLIREPKNYSLKQLDGHNWSQISLPVVFREGQYAIYYSKGAYSGQFVLMKNVEGNWKDICYTSVWSE